MYVMTRWERSGEKESARGTVRPDFITSADVVLTSSWLAAQERARKQQAGRCLCLRTLHTPVCPRENNITWRVGAKRAFGGWCHCTRGRADRCRLIVDPAGRSCIAEGRAMHPPAQHLAALGCWPCGTSETRETGHHLASPPPPPRMAHAPLARWVCAAQKCGEGHAVRGASDRVGGGVER